MRYRAILAGLFAAGCGRIDNFEVVRSATTTVQGAPGAARMSQSLAFEDFAIFDPNEADLSTDDIDSVRVKSILLRSIDPPGQTLTFIQRVEFTVRLGDMTGPRIASAGPFPSSSNSQEMEIDSVELAPYARTPSMNVAAKAEGSLPPRTTTLEAIITLDVDVDLVDAAL